MEVQKLQLLVTEESANRLLTAHFPPHSEVENLLVRLTPEGVVVSGKYPTMLLRVSFEAVWTVTVAAGGEVEARLASLRVAGLPAGKLKSVLFGMVRDELKGKAGVRVEEDVVRVSLNELLRAEGLPLRVTLTAIECAAGQIIVRAG
jgi:hypothetical protein